MRAGSSRNTGPMFPTWETSQPSTGAESSDPIACAAASPARTFPLRAKGPALKGSAPASGRNSLVAFARFVRRSSSWRTFQTCLFGGWMSFSGRWPGSGLMLNGRLYRRARWVRHIHERGCSLFATPCAGDSVGTNGGNMVRSFRRDCGGQPNPEFAEWVMGFPIGWTELEPLETPSSPRSPSGSDIDSTP